MECLHLMESCLTMSLRRGETFVTRKITIGLSRIINGLDNCLYLGNIYALRDWGTQKIMWKCVGKFYNIKKVMIL